MRGEALLCVSSLGPAPLAEPRAPPPPPQVAVFSPGTQKGGTCQGPKPFQVAYSVSLQEAEMGGGASRHSTAMSATR